MTSIYLFVDFPSSRPKRKPILLKVEIQTKEIYNLNNSQELNKLRNIFDVDNVKQEIEGSASNINGESLHEIEFALFLPNQKERIDQALKHGNIEADRDLETEVVEQLIQNITNLIKREAGNFIEEISITNIAPETEPKTERENGGFGSMGGIH